jgi:hypothetical protein
MLIGIGPGLPSLQDYTAHIPYDSVQMTAKQGVAQDQLTCTLWDPTNTTIVVPEDDIVVFDEADPNGWPSTNFMVNGSFEGTYSAGGVAPSWSANTVSGYILSQSATAKFGSASQSIQLNNTGNGQFLYLLQGTTLPTDEVGNVLKAQNYYATIWYQCTSAMSNAVWSFNLEWWTTGFGTHLSSVSTNLSTSVTSGWQQLVLTGTPPATATCVRLSVTTTTTSSFPFGTILLDGAQLEYATFAQALVIQSGVQQTALAAGKYPTPFMDVGQPGCMTDIATGYPYRSLRLFGGYIRVIEDDYTAGPEALRNITAVDYGVILSEAPLTILLQSQSDYNAIQAIVTYARNEGTYLVGLDTTTYVQTIGTIDAMTWSSSTVQTAFAQIADANIATLWVDYDKRLHYASSLAISAPFALSDNPNLVSTFPFGNFVYREDSSQSLTAKTIQGRTQLSLPQTYSTTGNGTTTVYTINGGAPLTQVDSVTVAGTAQTVGIANVNTYAQGYAALADYNAGTVTWNTAPASGAAIVVTFRYQTPVLIRVHSAAAESATGSVRRKIQSFSQYDSIVSQTSAIQRGTAELSLGTKALKVIKLTIDAPPCPIATPIRPGMAIALTHAGRQLSSVQFLVQQVTTYPLGFNAALGTVIMRRDLQLGYYLADAIQQIAQWRAQQQRLNTDVTGGNVLNDIQTAGPDGWAVTDSVNVAYSNSGNWDGPSTWDGTYVWD